MTADITVYSLDDLDGRAFIGFNGYGVKLYEASCTTCSSRFIGPDPLPAWRRHIADHRQGQIMAVPCGGAS